MFQPTPEFLQNFITQRKQILKEAQENNLTTLEQVIQMNIENTEKQLREFKTHFKQLELW